MSTLFDTASKIAKDAVDSPLTVMRKLGLNIPSKSDISTGVTTIAEDFSPAADIKEMVEGSEKISEGNPMSGLAQLVGGAFGAAIPFSGRVRSAGKAVGDIADKKLLDMKYTRETPKTKGGFSSVDLAAQGKITDKEAIGGMFNPISFGKDGMKVGKDASNLNTSRIEISTFDPASTPSSLGFGMKTADDIGLPASQVGTKTKDAIKVQTNLIEGSKWKWEGKVPKGFENNTHLVSMQGGSKLKKASGGPTDHSYATKVIYEKGGNLSTYDTRAKYVKELHKSIPESVAALKIKMPKEVKKLTKELKAEGKSTEEISSKITSLRKKLNRDYKGDNPKGKPTTVGIPEFGKKIGDIKKGGIIQPVYDQIIMREAGGQVMPMQYGGGLDDAYMTLSQRRNSAFADPNANSAFSSPMGQGGLPTIYREDGGTTVPKERMINDQPHQLSYINPEEAGLLQALGGSGRRVDGIPSYFFGDDGTGSNYGEGDSAAADTEADQADRDDGSASLAENAPDYETIGYVGEGQTAAFSEAASRAADLTNQQTFSQLGLPSYTAEQNNNRQGAGRRAMNQSAYTTLYNNLLEAFNNDGKAVDAAIENMTTAEGLAFQDRFDNGYERGGAFGSFQNIKENSFRDNINIDALLELDKKSKENKEEAKREGMSDLELTGRGLKGLYDSISNRFSLKSNVSPETISGIKDQVLSSGKYDWSPASNVMGNVMNIGTGLVPGGNLFKAGSSFTGGGKTIGVVTDKQSGRSYNLSDTGQFSMNLPTMEVDYGNDPAAPEKVEAEKIVETASTEGEASDGMLAFLANREKERPVRTVKDSNKHSDALYKELYKGINIG